MPGAAERIEHLRQEIRRHDHLYYDLAQTEISDEEYDKRMRELRELEEAHPELVTSDSPTQRVGGQPIEGFRTVRHELPMLSIDNTYSEEDVREFDARVRKALGLTPHHYTVDPKVDGVAMAIRYEKGLLALAVTRGDGRKGDDVTANVKTIRSVPLRLQGDDVPDVVEARGETYWPRKAFHAFNQRLAEAGEEAFANPRNGAAGTLKQLDPRVVAQRRLAFVAHSIGAVSRMPGERASEVMAAFAQWGIPINPHAKVCDDLDEVLAAIEHWRSARAEAEYDTDGMVVKVDELPLRERLGQTSKYPRWCIAYKYQAEQAATVLREVSFQVGRLGTITPVAHFDPVPLAGTTVSNATLHNFDQVGRLDVRVGDTIVVEKAGEIIPQVVAVLREKRPLKTEPILPPEACPSCGQPVARDEGGVYVRCANPECPAQIRERLDFFAGRRQMDIRNLGPSLIDKLVTKGLVKHFADLYALKTVDLTDLELGRYKRKKDGGEMPRLAREKTVNRLLKSIEKSKSQGLEGVLAALGIPHVGGTTAADLASEFHAMDELLRADTARIRRALTNPSKQAKRLQQVLREEGGLARMKGLSGDALVAALHGIKIPNGPKKKPTPLVTKKEAGAIVKRLPTTEDVEKADVDQITWALREEDPSVVANAVFGFLQSKAGQEAVDRLKGVGVSMVAQRGQERGREGPLTGKTAIVTGELEGFSRQEAEEAIKTAGGKVGSDVSKNTDFLVVGAGPGSKLKKARDLGVETIDEAEFVKRLGIKTKKSKTTLF